jgi:trans-aconitate 2-methyltransferase
MWDPSTYLRYGDERRRPFADLLNRVAVTDPVEVVDLGCGPGTLTVDLAHRWPKARIHGVDSSQEMITAARALNSPVEFTVGDVRDWRPDPNLDVIVANAVLQWVPGHDELLRQWVAALHPGAGLAFQVPGNFDAASHQSIRTVAGRPHWRDRVPELRDLASVLDPREYAALLVAAGCRVDAWETTYLHQLPVIGAEHPVLTWVEGTALRPVHSVLSDVEWQEFKSELRELLVVEYPETGGRVYFPFRRIFVVAEVG